jgi:hypothetical protein
MSSLRIFSILYLYRIKQARSSGSNCVYVVLLFFLDEQRFKVIQA